MANFTYTLADLEKAVTHAIGGAPDVNLDADSIINDAIQHLANLRPWRWRQRTLNLDSVNGQSYIVLPADFNMFLTVKKVGSSGDSLKPTSLDHIVQMRQTAGALSDVWYALSYQPQASASAEPLPVMELYPTPTSTTTGAPYYLTGIYMRQIPKLTGGTSLPDIPSYLHPALRMLVRAFAVSDEEQQRGADWAKFEDMIGPLEVEDGQATGYLGRARGGLAPPRPMSLANNTRQIAGP